MTETAIAHDVHPLDLLRHALDRGVEPAALKQMMDLANEWNRREGEAAYGEAMAAFQAECPQITKGRQVPNKDGTGRYTFAAYEDVDRVVRPLLAKHRVSTSCTVQTADGMHLICWRVQVGSYWRDLNYSLPAPDLKALAAQMRCNEVQAEIAVMSYLKRGTFCLALNIVVTDEDTDVTPAFQGISAEQAKELEDALKETRVRLEDFCGWASQREGREITGVSEVSEQTYRIALKDAKQRLGKKAKVTT